MFLFKRNCSISRNWWVIPINRVLLLLLLSSSLYDLNVKSIHKTCSSLPLVLNNHLYFPNRVVHPATIFFSVCVKKTEILSKLPVLIHVAQWNLHRLAKPFLLSEQFHAPLNLKKRGKYVFQKSCMKGIKGDRNAVSNWCLFS